LRTDQGYLLDANVLVALAVREHVHHQAARSWLASLNRSSTWWTTPVTELALVRLLLNASITGQSLEVYQALDVIRQIRTQPDHRFLGDSTSLIESSIDISGFATAKDATDFHLVNLAAAHTLVLVTFDARLARALAAPDQQHVLLLSA
jgi:uncharacterized protein